MHYVVQTSEIPEFEKFLNDRRICRGLIDICVDASLMLKKLSINMC